MERIACQTRLLLSGLCLAVLAMLPASGVSLAADAPAKTLPALRIIGIIPVQAENVQAAQGNTGWDDVRKSIDPMFSAVIRSSHRFQVLHDELVRINWEKPAGRQELVDKYELNAMTALSISTHGDDAVLVLRLLGPKMETWLLETQTVPRGWISQTPPRELRESMERLVFRLFNRLPVDVVVTSVQGRYLSLSGGEQQNVNVGDKVDIMRTTVASTHPVHGSWLTFHQVKLGEARIIDVKSVTSVAQILNLTFENAITVGDGARIPAIAGRAKFVRIAEEEEKIQAAKKGSAEKRGLQDVAPMFVDKGQPVPELADQQKAAVPAAPVTLPDAPATRGESVAAAPKPERKPDHDSEQPSSAGAEEGDGTPWVPDLNVNFETLANQYVGHVGPHVWSFSGPTSAKAKFPTILINRFGGELTRPLFGAVRMDLSADLLYGATSGGSYSGYQLAIRPHVAFPTAIIPNARFWKAGAIATATGIGADGVYGGGDWVQAGGFAGLGGTMNLEGLNLDWETRLNLQPMTLGRMGYDNKMHWIDSSMGWGIDLMAFEIKGPKNLEWGGMIHYESLSATFDDKQVGTLSAYAVQALLRYKL